MSTTWNPNGRWRPRLTVRALSIGLGGALLAVGVMTGVGAQPVDDEPPGANAGGAGAAIVQQDNSLRLNDNAAQVQRSSLYLRDPGTTDDWEVAGGQSADFEVRDPDNIERIQANWSSISASDRDISLIAPGPGGDILLTAGNADGGVGINAQPDRPLLVSGGSANSVITAQHSSGVDALRTLFSVVNFGPPSFTLIDTSANAPDWLFRSSQSGSFAISTNSTGVVELTLAPGGNLSIAGALTQGSGADNKHAVETVDPVAILDQVATLPISTWSYDAEPGVTHLGPMAEDFHDAFGLGHTRTGITAIDADGVALAAIQALVERNAELEARVAVLETQLGD